MSQLNGIPRIDLNDFISGNSLEREIFISNLYSGLQEYGFFILTGHTITQDIINNGYKAVKSFFELPRDIKLKYVSPQKGGQRGYTGFGKEHAKGQSLPDLKEFWHVGREISKDHPFNKYYAENIWPSEVENFKENMILLYEKLDEVGKIILHALSIALKVDPEIFSSILKDGNSILRPIHYPPLQGNYVDGAVRAAAHEDINLITLLMGATDSGLQLLDRDGKWLDIETLPGQIIVDSGDMLSRITGNHIPATTHRVINPKDSNSTRFSMPFFVHPHPEATLECLDLPNIDKTKFPPINANKFLCNRLQEIGLMD